MKHVVRRMSLFVVALVCLVAAVASAQESTTATAVKQFEVIAVEGNVLVVKLPEGTRQLTVPEDFQFTVDGQQMSVHDLKPGMKGTASITTKTTVTPVTVTEVKNGTVTQASGSNVIVQTDEGYKMFTQGALDKRGVKIMRDGKDVDISQLHTGDKLTATIITPKAPKVMTEKQVQASLAGSPAGAAPAGSTESAAAAQAAQAAPATPATLPSTASLLPLLGLIGFVSSLIGVALAALRRHRER